MHPLLVTLGLLALTAAPILALRFAWVWARKKRRQFDDRHPFYQRRKADEPARSTEEFFFAPMPEGWHSTGGFAWGIAVVGGLAILVHEALGR